MSEEKVISQEQLDQIEAEIKAKQAEELKKISDAKAVEIEEKVRKELTEKQEREAQLKRLSDLEVQNQNIRKEMEEKLKAERESFEKRLQELEATRKGIADVKSPFQEPSGNIKKGIDVDKLDLARVEAESKEAFKRHFGLPGHWGEKY